LSPKELAASLVAEVWSDFRNEIARSRWGEPAGEKSLWKSPWLRESRLNPRTIRWVVPSFENREDPGRRIRAVDGKSKSNGESLLSLLYSADGAWVSRSEQFASRRSGYSLSIWSL